MALSFVLHLFFKRTLRTRETVICLFWVVFARAVTVKGHDIFDLR